MELLAAEGASIMQPALDAVRAFDPATAVDEVPRLDGESLSLAKLEAALASDADGIALIKHLFPPPEHVTWEWAEERLCADCLLLTTQWFGYESRASVGKQQDASWSRLAAVRDLMRPCSNLLLCWRRERGWSRGRIGDTVPSLAAWPLATRLPQRARRADRPQALWGCRRSVRRRASPCAH